MGMETKMPNSRPCFPQHKCINDLKKGNPQHALKDKGVIDSGHSRHMTGNMSYLSNFEELNGGYVTFGGNPKGGKISVKCKIKTGKLDFDDVYFVKELKFNLFSVSQMCDKKNSVLFTDTECLVLSPDFKLPNKSQVLLRVPRENNMYNVNLKNIVPFRDLTFLFAKATIYESNLWHKRLGHINFKSMNKLVKCNLVRCLPTKVFKNDNTCVACKKRKQHRASCKTKLVISVDQPLYRLHMDLFGPTFVKSLNKKSYCLVVTDDYSRFTWVFFLATKDETSLILKTFITGLENQLSLKVKVIRSDNGTEFKNNDLNQFYGMKGIKKDSVYLKPLSKMALLRGKTGPSLRLLELCKFDVKVDEGFLVGYFVSSKAFRVFNSRTRIVQETLHVTFLENKPNVAGSGPTWLFDIDSLTRTMNYQPVIVGNQTNSSAGFQEKFTAEKAGEEIDQQYVLFPVWSFGFTNPQNNDGNVAFNENELDFNAKKPESKVIVSPSNSAQSKKQDDMTNKEAKGKIPTVGQISLNSTNTFSVAGPSNNVASLTHEKSSCIDASQLPDDPNMPKLEDIAYSDDEDDVGGTQEGTSSSKDPSWIEAMQEELLQFKMQKVWVLVDLPYGKRAIEGKSASTPIDTEKPLLKDPDGEDVDMHTYRSMIGSLMYLTSSKPDIMLVCVCARFQVTPKASHLHAVKRIFRYLKSKPHLGLWYPKDSPFDLVAYSDNDYVGASLDRKSTTEGCQFLGCRLISWQCKKQTVVATSSTDAEYVASASCCAQVLWIQLQLLDYGDSPLLGVNTPRSDEDRLELMELTVFLLPKVKKVRIGVNPVDLHVTAVNDVTRLQALVDKKKVVVTKATIREALRLDDAEGVDCLPNEEIFAELARMGYENPSTKLTFYKALFSSQWNLVRNVDSTTKLYMYPCFLQLIIRKQVGDLSTHTTKYTSPAITQKVFANIRRVGKGFSGVETPLFEGMLVEQEVDEEGDADENVEEVNAGDASKGDVSAAHGEVPTVTKEPS
nr:putative ribonuclease H-like domain-containing protein [Tanacetum cinerariifolium]